MGIVIFAGAIIIMLTLPLSYVQNFFNSSGVVGDLLN